MVPSQVTGVSDHFDYALDIMELLLDISSWLEINQHYIQAQEKVDNPNKGVAVPSHTECESPQQRLPATTSRRAWQMLCSPSAAAGHVSTATEELAEEVREAVTRRLCRKGIITISTLEELIDSNYPSRELTKRKKPLKSGKGLMSCFTPLLHSHLAMKICPCRCSLVAILLSWRQKSRHCNP